MRKTPSIFVSLLGSALVATLPRPSLACGCFAQPSPATPVVQAGERILFARDAGMVTAYIQIRYQGSADEFGWLVPLPSVPTLELGTDELFSQLNDKTQPDYRLTTNRIFCSGGEASSTRDSLGGCGGAEEATALNPEDAGINMATSDMASGGEVVAQSSIGPFDYAVLKADDQTAMLNWLQANRYFVPAATTSAITPYVHPGAYFLALKLHAGENAGDIVPIIVHYASDLPMIPIVLTSVGAVPHMGIQVWMLGDGRAIPRNYHAVELDDMPVWLASESYNQLLVDAVYAAPDHHAFVTEYAGSSSLMQNVLDYPGRFGSQTQLQSITDPSAYLAQLQLNGFLFDSTLVNILETVLPVPAEVLNEGYSPQYYYSHYDQFAYLRATADLGNTDGGAASAFDPVALTNELWTRIVTPTLNTGALFKAHPYLTRLYTALSPEDMTVDPVFSENPDLPDVQLLHQATLTYPCQGAPYLVSSDTGLETQFPSSAQPLAALKIETLREAGPPILEVDNTTTIQATLGTVNMGSGSNPSPGRSGCSVIPRGDRGMLLLIVGALLLVRRRRRVA